MRRFDRQGLALGGDVQVDGAGRASQPSVAAGPAGGVIIAWTDIDNEPAGGVFARRFAADGAPIGAEIHVNETTAEFQGRPDLAVSPDGSFLVVWEGQLDSSLASSRGFAQAFDAEGNRLGPEFRIHPEVENRQREPAVAATPEGSKVVVWRSQAADESWQVAGRQLDANNRLLAEAFQVSFVAPVFELADAHRSLDVATGAQGQFLATWVTPDSSETGIAAQSFFQNGSTSGQEILINQQQSGRQYLPAVASDGGEKFLFVWTGHDASGEGAFAVEHTFANLTEPELDAVDSVGNTADRFIDFGTQQGRQVVTETITNQGNQRLDVTEVQILGESAAFFSLDHQADFTPAPEEQRQLRVTFDPQGSGAGIFYAAVRLAHDDDRDILSGSFDASPYSINLLGQDLNRDFGDAPDTAAGTGTRNYNTLTSDGGPSHKIVEGLLMGASVDRDLGTLQNAAATADDLDRALPDDEDGLNNPQADLSLTISARKSRTGISLRWG